MKRLTLPKMTILCLMLATMAQAGSKSMNIQGKLTDAQGNALTGQQVVTFRLYTSVNAPVASAVWTESQNLNAQNGLISAGLGNANSLDALPFNVPYYLGMQVAGDPNELTPRQLLGASAYALGSLGDFNIGGNTVVKSSATVNGSLAVNSSLSVNGGLAVNNNISTNGNVLVKGNPLMPAGIIVPFGGSTAPAGYFLCDGSLVSRTAYPELFAAIGTTWGAGDGNTSFNVPDLRSRGLVAAGMGRGALSNRVLGQLFGEETHTLTTSEMPVHSHGVSDPGHAHHLIRGKGNGSVTTFSEYYTTGSANNIESFNFDQALKPSVTGVSIQNTGGGAGHNIMQPSAVVNYIIKS